MSDPATAGTAPTTVVIGGGPTGLALAILLASDGTPVSVYERRPDPRSTVAPTGRSINLTLSERGLSILGRIGLRAETEALAMPLAGRIIHTDRMRFVPYGDAAAHAIHSIPRAALHRLLLERAEHDPRISIHHDRALQDVDLDRRRLTFSGTSGRRFDVDYGLVVGADGAGSALRAAMVAAGHTLTVETTLDIGYKELRIEPDAGGRHRLVPLALHLWPAGDSVLLAFANRDGSFTASLFLPRAGEDSLASLTNAAAVDRYFGERFGSVCELDPGLADQFLDAPASHLRTVGVDGWTIGDSACLVGDAAHTLAPFYGQGLNLALTGAALLADRLRAGDGTGADRAVALRSYADTQQPDAAVIAELALANYAELRAGRSTGRGATAQRPGLEMPSGLAPGLIATEYQLVAFTTMPFVEIRGYLAAQDRLLQRLAAAGDRPDERERIVAELQRLATSDREFVPGR
ncbi:MAG: NAD(P)/FAD-dependent oxidoreductase [Actinomycetota bacterium]